MAEYPRLVPTRKTGAERFRDGPHDLPFAVDSFWKWSASDLLSNATRGRLAEYLVARAIGLDVDTTVRDEWDACDLHTTEGIRIEVKSSAYLQSWYQKNLSSISFGVPATRAWNPDDNSLADVPCRQAHLYVFALLAHTDKSTVDPLDLSQWRFYVLPTSVLDARTRSQHSITLRSLQGLAKELSYSELGEAVAEATQDIPQRAV